MLLDSVLLFVFMDAVLIFCCWYEHCRKTQSIVEGRKKSDTQTIINTSQIPLKHKKNYCSKITFVLVIINDERYQRYSLH